MVSSNVYDDGGVGDGNLTKQVQFPGGNEPNRVTLTWYDWRDRPVATKSGVQSNESDGTHRPLIYTDYDNLNEKTKVRQYDADGISSLAIVAGIPQPPSAGLLRAQTEYSYDEMSQLFRTAVFSVDPNSGAVSASSLKTDTYRDLRGLLIAQSNKDFDNNKKHSVQNISWTGPYTVWYDCKILN